ncbi:NADP-dependent malic enzyme [Anoxybacillus sp. P3H1B]|jgi:malic enzyme|nr:NADP-dependent malic enzyme [Anoxybacillus sp. P3H1B]
MYVSLRKEALYIHKAHEGKREMIAGAWIAEMIRSLNGRPMIFAMANPVLEMMPEEALQAGAVVVGTG